VACTLYRPACLGAGCGWVGDETTVENLTVAEVHDHSHPRWRELPVIARAPHDMDTARRDVWRLEVNRIYNGLDQPALLLLAGGVIRNARHPSGTRSHWTHQVDGYDIRARVNTDTTCLPPPCAAELPTLI